LRWRRSAHLIGRGLEVSKAGAASISLSVGNVVVHSLGRSQISQDASVKLGCPVIRNWGWRKTLAKLMSKSELIQNLADRHLNNISRKDIKSVIESLAEVGYKELKKTGAFLVPGFAKFVVIKKPATKARKGINPFTKEPTIFKAKPARKIIRARPVKAAKDAVA
jgi:DNA-binding protein HU-beta